MLVSVAQDYRVKMSSWNNCAPCKAALKTPRDVLGVLDKILGYLIKENQLEAHRDKIGKITDVLFDGFAPAWLSRNQKFDLSLTSEIKDSGLRFSYNNFDEKKGFQRKFLTVFRFFPNAFDLKALRLLFGYMGKTNDRHQTTIGCAWGQGEPVPRLKIYFEELYHHYTQLEIREKWKHINALMGIPSKHTCLLPYEKIGALAIDFVPFRPCEMKIYYLRPHMDRDEAGVFVKAGGFGKKDRLFEAFTKKFLDGERSFFYLTHRLSHEGRPLSFKLYKIFEVAGDPCPDRPLAEIKDFFRLSRLGLLEERLAAVRAIAEKKRFCVYPVIIACDKNRKRSRIDLYLALK